MLRHALSVKEKGLCASSARTMKTSSSHLRPPKSASVHVS